MGDAPKVSAAGEILSLPMFPGLKRIEQERVAEAMAGALVE
jgi:hypothetical protein